MGTRKHTYAYVTLSSSIAVVAPWPVFLTPLIPEGLFVWSVSPVARGPVRQKIQANFCSKMLLVYDRYFVTKGSADVMAFVVGGKFAADAAGPPNGRVASDGFP